MRVQRGRLRYCPSVLAVVLAATAPLARASAEGDLFDQLYQRGQKQNGALRTLTASFTETTTSELLTRPLTARGTVAVERPSRVALKYSEPDERLVIIDGDRLRVIWPARAVRQTRDIGAAQRRVQKYFVDSSPSELRTHFDIAARAVTDPAGYQITLLPKRRQIRDGLIRLDLWIDPESLLMTSMKMTFPNGDTKLMTFSNVQTNVVIDPAVFSIPHSAPVTRRFSGALEAAGLADGLTRR